VTERHPSAGSGQALLGVWNPSYASDAMDAHLRVLLNNIAGFRAGKVKEEDVYVWWGKVKSKNRLDGLPHLPEILAMDADLADQGESGRELHLYLTDYRSLYVGHVYEITAEDVTADEADHVPSYYRERRLHCDCWFRLGDIRRLVFDDTIEVIAQLKKLRNTHYGDRAVSLYGGMVNLPLIVSRDDGERFFEPAMRSSLLDGQYWAEADAGRTGLGAIERELRENLLGEEAWNGLDLTTRTFVATAELVFRTHRGDAGFDFAGVVVNLAKALEVQVTGLVRRALAGAPEGERTVVIDGKPIDVTKGTPLTLGTLGYVLAKDKTIRDALKPRLINGDWLLTSGGPVLQTFSRHRNPAAHSQVVSRDEARRLRNQLLGIGGQGDLVQLAGTRPR
jgi:hypothetical protein